MQANATYSVSGGTPQPAVVLLQKTALHIVLQQAEERTVIWHYDGIVKNGETDFVFAYAAYPPQILTLQERTLADRLRVRLQQKEHAFFSKRRTTFLKVLAGFVMLVTVAYFFILPWLAGYFANRFSVQYEQELGDELYEAMRKNFEVDDQKTASLNAFFQQLRIASPYNIRITVVKSNMVNAFAIPGGHIVVYDKLIDGLHSYPEMAALLAHEYVHVRNRHSLKSLFQQLSFTLFFSLLLGDAGGVGSTIINNANNLKSLSYSRRLENEADEQGAFLLTERGIDCKGFVQLFRLLQKENKKEPSEWTSSHPNLNKRIHHIQQNDYCLQQTATDDTTLQQLFLNLKKPG